jgi:hypothetical protein
VFPSDLPGVNPATLNGMILYCRLTNKWSGLGDSTELSRMGLSQSLSPTQPRLAPHGLNHALDFINKYIFDKLSYL